MNTDKTVFEKIIIQILDNLTAGSSKNDISIDFKESKTNDEIFFSIINNSPETESLKTKKKQSTFIINTEIESLIKLLGGKIIENSEIKSNHKIEFSMPVFINFGTIKYPRQNEDKFNWKNKTLIIAEDDDINFYYLKKLLANFSLNILHAVTGEHVVEYVKSGMKIDLILMDIKMPGMSGIEATKVVKSLNPNIPVIAQTAFVMEDEIENEIKVNCNGFIPKPIKKVELFSVMNKYLQ